jgi:endonuclease III
MNRQQVRQIFIHLRAANPHPRSELLFDTPFQLLIAVILSAQATDKGVNLATRALFRDAPTPAAMLKLGLPGLKRYIRTIGLFNAKARNILATCRLLLERHGGEVPRDRAALEELPGVGRKTANVVLGDAFGKPSIVVDTHFARLARRFGWTAQTDPDKIEHDVAALLPPREWTAVSHRVIWHGRRVCHARRPACGACGVARWCPSFGAGPTDEATARKLVKAGPFS